MEPAPFQDRSCAWGCGMGSRRTPEGAHLGERPVWPEPPLPVYPAPPPTLKRVLLWQFFLREGLSAEDLEE